MLTTTEASMHHPNRYGRSLRWVFALTACACSFVLFTYLSDTVSFRGATNVDPASKTRGRRRLQEEFTTSEAIRKHAAIRKNTASGGAIPGATELLSLSSRFHIYDDSVVSQSFLVEKLRTMGETALGEPARVLDHVLADVEGERSILEALRSHPLRTWNPNEAEIFVVPTPVSELLAYGCQWEDCSWYDDAFRALSKHPVFTKTGGRNHVIIALNSRLFNRRYSAYYPALSRNYRLLENVTVALHYDPFGSISLSESTKDDDQSDFKNLFASEFPITNAFSLGMGFDEPFPMVIPTYAKFKSSDNFIFYHTRQKTFEHGSTKYRNAPLDDKVVTALPPSSIGHEVPKNEWTTAITSSKFCLVIRGDTPHSHSLLYAVRAGCIPVIVSNHYQAYAGPFKSSLSIKEFSIFIDEATFLEDPKGELLKLEEVPIGNIKSKLKQLRRAQSILIPDNSESLFVPAFLREAIAAGTNVLPSTRATVQVHEASVTISGRELMYRYPSTLNAEPSEDDGPNVFMGILSSSSSFNARHSIRETWALTDPNHVFFVVAGPWQTIADEFYLYGDLLWIDMDEDYYGITYKSQVFFYAVNAHVEAYDYVMKTDNDVYVAFDEVKRQLGESKPDYWGSCMSLRPLRDPSEKHYMSEEMWPFRVFPVFARGLGYGLSRDFNECVSGLISTARYLNMEDLHTGVLALECGVKCSRDGWDTEDPLIPEFFSHGAENHEAMVSKHWETQMLKRLKE